jgi:hypothetical protein
MRQIVISMICYGSESSGVWPMDLKAIQDWSDGELVPKLFQDPRWPTDPDPFIYVRPSPTARAAQPVLLSRPTKGRSQIVLICYGDSHIGQVTGTAQWDEAKWLAALPKAREGGIEPSDWTTVPELRSPAATVKP